MKKNLAKKISAGILAAFLGMSIGYCDSVWADWGEGEEHSNWHNESNNSYYGMYSTKRNAVVQNGAVEINGGQNYNTVFGGYSTGLNNRDTVVTDYDNEANKNKVTINGGAITGSQFELPINGKYVNVAVVGGFGSFKANNNEVFINEGNITGNIYGGLALKKGGESCANTVEITGGTITGDVYGAFDNTSEIIANNKVIIYGGTIIGTVYAADATNGQLNNNGIIINGNTGYDLDLSHANLAGVDSGHNFENIYCNINDFTGEIKNITRFTNIKIENSITIIGEINNLTEYGGGIENLQGVLDVSDSNVTVDNIDLYYYDVDWNDRGGKVNIKDSRFTVNDTMAYVENLNISNSTLTAGELGDCWNINIENSDVDVNKGTSWFHNIDIKNTSDHKLNLGEIYGGYSDSKISTNSVFNADSITGLSELNVDMTSIAWEKDGTVIDVAGKADFKDTTVSVNGKLAAAAGTEISNSDSMSFIKAGELTGIKAADIDDSKLYIGFAKEADVTLTDNGNSIDFVVSGMPQASDQTTIIGDSRTAAIAFANQGSDVLNEVLSSIDEEEYGIKTFAVVHGNRSKYDVASDIKINGWSVLTGVGETKKVNDDLLSWGVFYENGSGNYRTYNSFNGNDLTGFGSSVYNGGGAMLRYDNNSGTYIQAGVRAGNLKNSLGDAVADGFGTVGGYSIDSFYYGTLLGVGKIIQLNETDNIDVYGKYFYTHHDGESVNILGDDVNFDSAESNRVRLGARYNKTLSEKLSGYYGLAWDYEFSGDADTYIAGFDVDNESLKGSTAVIEAGLHYAPDNSPWSIDLGLQGYAGQRDGFSGNVQATYTF